MEKRASIKTDVETMKKISKIVKSPSLGFKSKAQFAREAINEKVARIEKEQLDKKLTEFDISKNYYEMARLKKEVEELRKDVNDRKREEELVRRMGEIDNKKIDAMKKKDDDEFFRLCEEWDKLFEEYKELI